jgi:hypothetical protein
MIIVIIDFQSTKYGYLMGKKVITLSKTKILQNYKRMEGS